MARDGLKYNPPENEDSHLKAIYDYLLFINNSEKMKIRGHSFRFYWTSKNINDIIQDFIDMAFKPLIDFINDRLSTDMIILDEETKITAGNTFIQNIDTLHGTANQQANGAIYTYNTNNNVAEILSIIDKLLPSLEKIKDVNADEIESVKDDLEVVKEQIESALPKINRLYSNKFTNSQNMINYNL